MSAQVEKLNGRIDHLNEVIQMKDEVIKAKNLEIKNLKSEVANGRRHRFCPTTEQRDFLNNRKTDVEGERKDAFDGTLESLPPGSEHPNDDMSSGAFCLEPIRTSVTSCPATIRHMNYPR